MAFESESVELENATPIQYLNLTSMTINLLHRGKIETIEHLVSTDDCYLRAINGISSGRVNEIDEALKAFGLVRE